MGIKEKLKGAIDSYKKEQLIKKAGRQRGAFLAKKARRKAAYKKSVAYGKRGGLAGDLMRKGSKLAEGAMKEMKQPPSLGKGQTFKPTKPSKYELGVGPV